jgi:hypothetical protein
MTIISTLCPKILSTCFSVEHEPDSIDYQELRLLDCMKRIRPHQFERLAQKDLYKILFMETKDLARGKFGMDEKEPGYLARIMEGYRFMLETLDKPLTADLYQKLHDTCSAGVVSDDAPEGIPAGFRVYADGAEAFQVILGSTLSQKGYDELLLKMKSCKIQVDQNTYYPFKEAIYDPSKSMDLTGSKPSFLKLKPVSMETCAFNVSYCIARFECMPKTNEAEKLFATAQLIQDLDQMHVFVDGNIRTTGIIMLNRTLLSLDLNPSVLEDVNCLDCLSVEEIVEKIKDGQRFFSSLTS